MEKSLSKPHTKFPFHPSKLYEKGDVANNTLHPLKVISKVYFLLMRSLQFLQEQ